MTAPGHDEKPNFEAEEAPPFEVEEAPPRVWEQIVGALRPRRTTTHVPEKAARPQRTLNILMATGKSLVGAIGGVLLVLGTLGVGMSLLLVVTLVVTQMQGLQTGIRWPVVPISLLIFGVVGVVGYVLLRSIGMLARPKQ